MLPKRTSDKSNDERELPPYEIVRSTCVAFDTDRCVFDQAAADRFVEELDARKVREFGSSLANDANFTGTQVGFDGSRETEAAFIVLMHALDFGSGWRKQLHKHNNGKGAWLSIKPGIEKFYGSHPGLNSSELAATTKDEVAEAFDFAGNEDLDDLVCLLHGVIKELGARTVDDYGSLVSFVEAKLGEAWSCNGGTTPAGNLVWNLVETFPETFDDCYTVGDQRVCFYKKAQLVVGEIYHRFRQEDERFRFSDGDKLTAYIDNVICASLRYKKVIVPCQKLEEAIEGGTEILSGSEDEVALRSAAMVGVEYVASATGILSPAELGNYLWAGLGKTPQVRKFQRHATKTVFY